MRYHGMLFILLTLCLSSANAHYKFHHSYDQDPTTMQLTSSSLTANESVPTVNTCDGLDISPSLAWSNVPENTKSLVLEVFDPDAPTGSWTHWFVYNIPPNVTEFGEGITKFPPGTQVYYNSWHKQQYNGPCPPAGSHRYVFMLYALNEMLPVIKEDGKIGELLKQMQGHIVGNAQIVTNYASQKSTKHN